MDSNDSLNEWKNKPLNPWQPEQDKIRLAILGKFLEELNECGAIVARCIIQGVDGCEPVTKVPNREALEKEIADVEATLTDVIKHFHLSQNSIGIRGNEKRKHLARWRKLLEEKAGTEKRRRLARWRELPGD